MRFSRSVILFGAFVLFNTIIAQAAPIDQIIHAGQTWQKFPKSICENGSKAIKWKDVYWCPLTSYKYPQVDHRKPQVATPATPKPVAPAPAPAPTQQVHQIIHDGQTWQKFASSICENGSKAIKWKEVYWCPLTSYKTPQIDYKKPQVAAPTPTQPVAPAPTPAPKPVESVHQIIHDGQTWQKFPTSICENGSKAIKWKEVYWCPLTSYKTAQVDYKKPQGGVVSPTPVPTPVPTPTPPVTVEPTYSAQLSWAPPALREDGNALIVSEINRYEVYYVSDDGSDSGTLVVSGGAKNSCVVAGLASGVWHFSITAIDNQGAKSRLSSVLTGSVGS